MVIQKTALNLSQRSPLNLKNLKIMKRLLTSTRNALMLVLKLGQLKVNPKHTWASEFVKKKYSISLIQKVIQKPLEKKLLMPVIQDLKKKLVFIWSGSIKKQLYNLWTSTTMIKHSPSSNCALMPLKEQKIKLWKLNVIKKQVRSKNDWEIWKKLLSTLINSWSFAMRPETEQKPAKHINSWLKLIPKTTMYTLPLSILKTC